MTDGEYALALGGLMRRYAHGEVSRREMEAERDQLRRARGAARIGHPIDLTEQQRMTFDRADWLEWRRGGIGASDIAAIAAVEGAYGSPWSVWISKVAPTVDDTDSTDMEFGRYAEPMVANWFADKHALRVIGVQTRCTHPEHQWALATADGFVADIDGVLGGLEIKTAREPWPDGPPLAYQAQAQWSMFVTGQPRWWIACYHRTLTGDPFTVHCIERDDTDIAYLHQAATTFWHDHVLTGTPPAVDAHPATSEALNNAWPNPTDTTIEADDQLAATVALLGARKAEARNLDAKITELENRVKAAIADHSTLTCGHDAKNRPRVIATWKPQERNGFDHAAALTDDPTLARYKTITVSRVLRLKPTKEN